MMLTVFDVYTCGNLVLESDASVSGEQVARVLRRISYSRGQPRPS